MYKWYSFQGWQKPANKQEVFERMEKVNPKFAGSLKFRQQFSILIGGMSGFTFGMLFTRKNEWLDNLSPFLDEHSILSAAIFGALGAIIFAFITRKFANLMALKYLQKYEYKVSKK